MDTITTIKDYRIRVKVSNKLIELLEQNKKHFTEVPENISKLLRTKSLEFSSNVETIDDSLQTKTPAIDLKLLKELLQQEVKLDSTEHNKKKDLKQSSSTEIYLYLNDLRWISNSLVLLRKNQGLDVYLNDMLQTSQLVLPENEVIKRNPELEARCQKLREEQQNLEYRKMTKNVDAVLQHYPEDTVAYQSE